MNRGRRNNGEQEENVVNFPSIVDITLELVQNSVNYKDQPKQKPKSVKKNKRNGKEKEADDAEDSESEASDKEE